MARYVKNIAKIVSSGTNISTACKYVVAVEIALDNEAGKETLGNNLMGVVRA